MIGAASAPATNDPRKWDHSQIGRTLTGLSRALVLDPLLKGDFDQKIELIKQLRRKRN